MGGLGWLVLWLADGWEAKGEILDGCLLLEASLHQKDAVEGMWLFEG